MFDTLRQDVRAGLRSYARSPGFVATAVLTLALGVGLAVAMYSVADTLLIRRLPVHDESRIVVLWGKSHDGKYDNYPLASHEMAASFARRTRSLSSVAFFSREGAYQVPIVVDGALTRLSRALVSGSFFDVLGSKPILGRSFRPEDDAHGAAPVAILSYAGWQRQFGGDPRVIGRHFIEYSSGLDVTIVGVMPQGLDYPRGVEFWMSEMPAVTAANSDHPFVELDAIGRLAAGGSPITACDELTDVFAREGKSKLEQGVAGVVTSFPTLVLGDVKPAAVAFSVAVALLLLITCINVANLLLVRGIGRAAEISVRAALGASRGRIVLQLLTETSMLALAGAVLGAGFGAAALRAFVALAPTDLPRLDELHVGTGVLGVALVVTTLSAMIFGVVPAVVAANGNVADVLRGGRGQSGGTRVRRATKALVAGQMALALAVLSAAVLLSRSLIALDHVELNFDSSRLVMAELTLRGTTFATRDKQIALLDELLPRVRAIPGVLAASPVGNIPFSGAGIDYQPTVEGQSKEDAATNPMVSIEAIAPSYFETLGVPLTAGRAFASADRSGSAPVVIINQSLADRLWPKQNAIGKRISGAGTTMTVVGIAAPTRYRDLRDARLSAYIPIGQSPFPGAPMTLAIRTRRTEDAIVPALRSAIGDIDPGVALASMRTVDDLLSAPLAHPRLNAVLLGVFALSSLMLAAVGLFGVMAATVRQRTGEIGIRMALGATGAEIGRLVMAQGVAIAVIGVPIGLMLSAIGAALLRGILYGVSPFDVVSFGVATLLLIAVATLAAGLPALSSARIDPLIALRREG